MAKKYEHITLIDRTSDRPLQIAYRPGVTEKISQLAGQLHLSGNYGQAPDSESCFWSAETTNDSNATNTRPSMHLMPMAALADYAKNPIMESRRRSGDRVVGGTRIGGA